MLIRRLAAAAAALAVSIIVGCGSTAPVDTFEVGAASLSAQQACSASAATICERAHECTPYWFSRFYTSVATCTSVFEERCLDRYRGEAAAKDIADCSAAVRSLTCDELTNAAFTKYFDAKALILSCPVTPGTFAKGERCLRDGDCTTGRCVWAHGHAGCGACGDPLPQTTYRKLGEACASSDECASRYCAQGACGALPRLGESCAERPCDVLGGITCGSDLKCRPFGDARIGEPCSFGTSCEAGATCVTEPAGSTSGTCKPAPTAGVGQDCARGCAAELTCVSGRCAAPNPGLLKSCAP